jgi:hypothetical protein
LREALLAINTGADCGDAPAGDDDNQVTFDAGGAYVITPATAKVRVNDREYAPTDRDVVFVEPGDVTIEVGGLPGYEAERRTVKAALPTRMEHHDKARGRPA